MKTLLQINTSIFAAHGQSTRLNEEFVAAWKAANPLGDVVVRDFAREPVPHLTGERFQAFIAKAEERTAAQQQTAAYSDALIAEIREADLLVIGLPMYNFGIPSMLQSYFDHVGRAGVTFRYGETGPVGAFPGKKAIVFATRGGMHAGTARDVQVDHVRNFLGLIGITDVEVIYAEGMGMSGGAKEAGIAKAQARIAALINSKAEIAANDASAAEVAKAA